MDNKEALQIKVKRGQHGTMQTVDTFSRLVMDSPRMAAHSLGGTRGQAACIDRAIGRYGSQRSTAKGQRSPRRPEGPSVVQHQISPPGVSPVLSQS